MDARTNSPWNALPALLAGAVMVVLDFFIVNVALPSIAVDLRASSTSLIWVVAGYGLSFAAFLILAGRAGDRFGRRRVYVTGLALFTTASAACGFAPTDTALIAARFVQGAAGAIVMPQVLAIIAGTFRGPDYARAMSVYGIALGLAAVGGEVVGGALVEGDVAGLGWRSCFLINVPIGLAALVASRTLVPESRAQSAGRLDVGGAALLAAGLTALLLPLVEGQHYGWPLWTWLSFAAADAILTVFVLHQRRRTQRERDPLVNLRMLQNRHFAAALLAQLTLGCAQASFFVYLALYLQDGRGLKPLEAGLVFTVVAVGYVAASAPAPSLLQRYGRALIAAGGLSLAAGLALLAVAVEAVGVGGSVVALAPGLLLAGIGIGLCYTPIQATVMSSVAPAQSGAAAGMSATITQVGYAVGVAVTGVIYFAQADAGIAHAFDLSLIELAGFGLVLAAATRLLPGRHPAARVPAAAGARS